MRRGWKSTTESRRIEILIKPEVIAVNRKDRVIWAMEEWKEYIGYEKMC